mmetsp:Transcript_3763/g.5903  ORF Transcript_3763/g.5903 Transcript_3763/m.5903 type:complete len:222 (+) Transcript_3763:2950-3615(+)
MKFPPLAVELVLLLLSSTPSTTDAFVVTQRPNVGATRLKYKIIDPNAGGSSSSSSSSMNAGSGIGFGAGDNLSANNNNGGGEKEYKSELVARWEKEQAQKNGGGGGGGTSGNQFGSGAGGVPGFGAPSSPSGGGGGGNAFGSGASGVPGFGAPSAASSSSSSSSSGKTARVRPPLRRGCGPISIWPFCRNQRCLLSPIGHSQRPTSFDLCLLRRRLRGSSR